MKLAHISTSGKWRLSRPPARMLGAREPSIWDTTRQCHRPRSFVRMRAEHRRRRDGRWCGRRNSGVPRSIADPSFLLGARGLTQPAAPNPAQPIARWCQRRRPTDFPAAPWLGSPRLRCRRSRKNSLSSLGSCSAPTGTWRQSIPNANQFLTEATNIVVSTVLVDGMPVKIVATAQSGRPAMS